MKNKLFTLFIVSLLFGMTSCELFEPDNFPVPDARVFGGIRDVEGGALVETDLNNGTKIGTYELGGYESPELRNWVVMQNGEYRNNLVFPNTYKIEFTDCNFFPFTIDEVTFKSGDNPLDFTVTPYIRIKNCKIVQDGDFVKATFNLEPGKSTVKLASLNLYVFTDKFVGEYVKLSPSKGKGTPSRSYSTPATIDPNQVYELSIDLAANKAGVFKTNRNYYFRVGAKASQSGVGTIRANYAPYVKIPLALN